MRGICFFLLLTILTSRSPVNSQSKNQNPQRPKLVVGIVVDQLRNEFIYRYWNRFGAGGFKRLVNEGYYFRNTHYNYVPTYTGPGHCSIYTGTTPRNHGIIANDWFVKNDQSWTGCVSDENVKTVGAENRSGQASPKKQLSSTIGDELKLTHKEAKVFAIAVKDRAAILPAGHNADGAFWMDESSGNFVSSTWYVNELPAWAKKFNDEGHPLMHLKKGWQPLYPLSTYTASLPDENSYESAPFKDKPVFPYNFNYHIDKKQFGIVKATPYGNTITKDLAKACIKNENLGKDDVTDLFCLSFSSTDVIGHSFGPRSVEVEDTYLRLDQDLADLFAFLDQQVGSSNYVVFLTADHGVGEVPNHLKEQKIAAGLINIKELRKDLKSFFHSNYGDSLIVANLSNEQLFLNESKIIERKLDKDEVERRVCNFLINYEGIAEAYPSETMKQLSFENRDMRNFLQAGYNHKRSGNVCMVFEPAWMEHGETGTTHGAGYHYDTHVPLIFMGAGIKQGQEFGYTTITQIAPTISELLKINQPNSCDSDPLHNVFR